MRKAIYGSIIGLLFVATIWISIALTHKSEKESHMIRSKENQDKISAWIKEKKIKNSENKKMAMTGPPKAYFIPMGTENPLKSDSSTIATGEKKFMISCSSCHARDGSRTAHAPALNDTTWIYSEGTIHDAALFNLIAFGSDDRIGKELVPGKVLRGGMPAQWSELSPKEIWTILTYVRSLR